ncbi:MAG: outer membrane assembly protein, partial [Marivirga sp.]|nr:outer membrane assembly protein [Marivirga sp.]
MGNMEGEILMKDGVLSIRESGFNSLNARFMASGTYDSRDLEHPLFDFNLKIDELDIQKAYKGMKIMRELLPAAADAHGLFSIDYKLRGELDSSMYPKTTTLIGGGDMHIADAKINGMKVFERLSKAAKKKEMNDPHLKDFTMTTEIRNNKIFVRPFTVVVSGFNTEIEGVNDISGTVNYILKVQLLGIDKLRIPFNVSGTYNNPKVALGKGHKLPEEGVNN